MSIFGSVAIDDELEKVKAFFTSYYAQRGVESPGVKFHILKKSCSVFKKRKYADLKAWFRSRPAEYTVMGQLVIAHDVLGNILRANPAGNANGNGIHAPALMAPVASMPIPAAVLATLTDPPPAARLNLYCRICGIRCTSEMNMREHLRGERHWAAVAAADEHQLEEAVRAVASKEELAGSNCQHCELCGKWFTSTAGFTSHIGSAQHRARVFWLLLRRDPSLIASTTTAGSTGPAPPPPRPTSSSDCVTISALPDRLPPVPPHTTAVYPFTITNRGPGSVKLRSAHFLVQTTDTSMRLEDDNGTAGQPPGRPTWIGQGESYEVRLVLAPTAMGLMRGLVVFDLAPSTVLARAVAAVCAPPDLPPPAPPGEQGGGGGWQRTKHRLEPVNEDVVQGIPPPGLTSGTRTAVPLRSLPPPERLRQALTTAAWPLLRRIIPPLREVTSMKQYAERLQQLLWLEELQHEIDIRVYDMKGVTLVQAGRTHFLELEVPGLAENRPSVLKGDRLLVAPSEKGPEGSSVRRPRREYEGFVHSVQKETVKLRFADSFINSGVWLKGRRFDVRFTVNRSAFNLMQNALVRAAERSQLSPFLAMPGSALAPLLATSPPGLPLVEPLGGDSAYGRLAWQDSQLNEEQRLAVREVVRGRHAPLPYIIYGPPGTGKTSTLVEAARQLLLTNPAHRLLLVAPSNSAADQLIQRLSSLSKKAAFGPASPGGLGGGAGGGGGGFVNRCGPGDSLLMRVCAFSRPLDDLPLDIRTMATSYGLCPGAGQGGQRVCSVNWDSEHEAFLMPPLEMLLAPKLRAVVTTCAMAARLVHAGVPAGHFTHVLVDEAGHAEEPLQLCALAGLTTASTRVVMAGDPKQLGPIILSLFARKHGRLDVSMMERLLAAPGPPFGRRTGNKAGPGLLPPYDSVYVTKLLHNYRSHPAILRVPNAAFYNDELIAAAPAEMVGSMLSWEELPNNRVPMLMHHIVGKDEQEANSPSWQNLLEARQVLEYVKLIMAKRRGGRVQAGDIGIISPYKKQVQRIRAQLKELAQYIKVGSVEEFQGQEKLCIIISTVRSSDEYLDFDSKHRLGFLSNPKRFNVAITRAKALVVVVGNAQVLVQDPHWRSLLRFLRAAGAIVGQSLPAKVAERLDAPPDLDRAAYDSDSDEDEERTQGGAKNGGRDGADAVDVPESGSGRAREPSLPELAEALRRRGAGRSRAAVADEVDALASTLERLVLRGQAAPGPGQEVYEAMLTTGVQVQVEGGEMRRFD